MTTSFTSMDVSTADEWVVIGTETMKNQSRVADRVLAMLESLSDVVDGFAVDQLTHCLQTATRAERAGADDELVVASLCHDIGKAVSVPNHPRIAAEILRPYVRPEVTAAIPPIRTSRAGTTTTTSTWTRTCGTGTGTSPGTSWPSSSPTSGTRTASTRTTPPSRWPTSSRRCGPSSAIPTVF